MSDKIGKVLLKSLDDDSLIDRNTGSVKITRNGKVIEISVSSLHDHEMMAIQNMTKFPSPPKKKVAKTDERGKVVVDLQTKQTIYETISDDLDPEHVAKCEELQRKRHLLIVVNAMQIEWPDKITDDKKIELLTKKFSSSEIMEILSRVLELGIVDFDLVEQEKNESSRNALPPEVDGVAV